jgi:flagellum-specific peptidoglycan hydrolase FlgJ
MNVDQLQQLLLSHGSQDTALQAAAQTANQYTELLKCGLLTQTEYVQLINDIVKTNDINKNMDNMEVTELINVTLTGLITLASLA